MAENFSKTLVLLSVASVSSNIIEAVAANKA